MKPLSPYEAIVVGASAGGLYALADLLQLLPPDFCLPLIIVQHRSKDSGALLEEVLQSKCRLTVKQADEKERVVPGFVYVAPPNYHLLIEHDRTFSLSADILVGFSRPSIDVLFESAADVYRERLIGVVLTGSNSDGARGVRTIFTAQGVTIAQDPQEAQFPPMPLAAIQTGCVRHKLTIASIGQFLHGVCPPSGAKEYE